MVCVWGLIVGYAGSRRAHLWSTVVTRDIWRNHLSHHLTAFCYRDVRQTQLSAAFSAAWMYFAVTQGWLLVENWDIHIVGMALLSRLIKGRQACKEVKKRLWAWRQELNHSVQVAEKIPLYIRLWEKGINWFALYVIVWNLSSRRSGVVHFLHFHSARCHIAVNNVYDKI